MLTGVIFFFADDQRGKLQNGERDGRADGEERWR